MALTAMMRYIGLEPIDVVMKLGGTTKIGGVGPLRRAERKTTEKGSEASQPRNIDDTVSVLGIPPEEMTPKVRTAIMQLVEEVNRLREELAMAKQRLDEMETLADEDALVPATNRRAFVRELTRVISFCERYGAPCSMLYLDLDDLKQINDEYGHAAGDAALRHFTEILRENVRESDVVGRIGGDEFAVILLNSDEETARSKAKELEDRLADAPLEWDGQSIRLNAAYGVFGFRPGVDANEAMAEADKAMYAEKRRSKEKA